MVRRRAFTLVELLVVIAIIAVLMAILMGSLARVREAGKRTLCQSNVRQLTAVWSMYADDNDDKIVSGSTGSSGWDTVLMSYIHTPTILRCPTGETGEKITYAAVDYMNGYNMQAYQPSEGFPENIKKKSKIKNSGGQAVFLDEGRLSQYSWTVWHNKEWWWDQITTRHGNGTNWSFADGHVEYAKWFDPRTTEVAQAELKDWQDNRRKQAQYAHQPGNKDLHWVQSVAWGRLFYGPAR